MRNANFVILFTTFLITSGAFAQQVGTASGNGVIERFNSLDPGAPTEMVPFAPRFSYAYKEGTGKAASTWIVLSDQAPPIRELLDSKDRPEARRAWCQKAKASFVAVKLDADFAVDLYYLCPANGSVNTEMLSRINGLDSVVINFESKSDSQLKGSLTGGEGFCSDGEESKYCTQESDYKFDAPIIK